MPSAITLAAAVAVATVAAAGTGGAAAAEHPPRAWPGLVIGYRDLTGAHGYHAAVLRAVAAWNGLLLGVRFVPAPTGLSAVQIVFAPGRCLGARAGSAPVGWQRFGARVVVRACPRVVRPLLVAHELGRVLGLGNDDGSCSLMNSKGASDGRTFAAPARCSRYAPPEWLPRLVDPLTETRARRLYASPPAALDVQLTPGAPPRLDWRQPPGSSRRTIVLRTVDRCPARSDVAGRTDAAVVYSKPSYAGAHWTVDAQLGSRPGSYCYRLFNLSAAGRPTPSKPFPLVVGAPPVAAAGLTSAATAGEPVVFADRSTGEIVHWHWDFGDPASGAGNVVDTADPTAGRAPTHTYAATGTYTVGLTVTDDLGRSATTSIAVTVQ